MGSSVSYEVMGYKDGHWSILFITDNRDEAVSEAKAAEAGKHIQAVKVVQESVDDETGDERSKTIYSGGVQDGTAVSHTHQHKAPQKGQAAHGSAGKTDPVAGKQNLHPELVTDFIDQIKKSVIVIGGVVFTLFILAIVYLSYPEAVSGLIDGMLK